MNNIPAYESNIVSIYNILLKKRERILLDIKATQEALDDNDTKRDYMRVLELKDDLKTDKFELDEINNKILAIEGKLNTERTFIKVKK